MKFSLIFILALIYLNLLGSRSYADDKVILGGVDVCRFLNASSVTNINGSSIDKPHGFCPIEQTSIRTSLLDNIYPFLEKIENDFKIGLYYGLYIPAVSGLINIPLSFVFNVGSPYHRNSGTTQSLFSTTKEEQLKFYRSVWAESYYEKIITSVEEEFLYRFFGLSAIEAHVKYLLGAFGYDSN